MKHRAVTAVVLVLLALPMSLSAQHSFAPSSPEAVTIAYIDAMKEARLDEMAGMMHAEALAEFRGVLQPVLEAADASEEGAAEILPMFDGVTSVAQLKTLSDVKFYSSFYAGLLSLEPELLNAIKESEIEVLGHVIEGADTAHVLYRMTVHVGATVRSTEVVSLRRIRSGWGILLSGEVEGMAQGIRQSLEMRR